MFLSFFLSPRLKRNGIFAYLSRRKYGLRFRSGNPWLISRHLKVPRATTRAAALIDAGQIRFAIGGARNRAGRLIF